MRRALQARRPRVGDKARVVPAISWRAFGPRVPKLVGPFAGRPAVHLGRPSGPQVNEHAFWAESAGGSPVVPHSRTRLMCACRWRAQSGDAASSANKRAHRWPNPHHPVPGEQCELLGGRLP